MSGWNEIEHTKILDMKKEGILELPWDCEATDCLYCYEMNNQIIAIIRLSQILEDKGVIWIDEFEVLREYRKQGVGQKIIRGFLEECDFPIILMAKNKSVANFWQKCGFEYEIDEWNEIKMIFEKG